MAKIYTVGDEDLIEGDKQASQASQTIAKDSKRPNPLSAMMAGLAQGAMAGQSPMISKLPDEPLTKEQGMERLSRTAQAVPFMVQPEIGAAQGLLGRSALLAGNSAVGSGVPKFFEELFKGKGIKESGKEAVISGGVAGATGGVLPIAGNALKFAGKHILPVTSSMPAKSVARGIERPEILEGKFNPREPFNIGQTAKTAYDTVEKEVGQKVGKVKDALKASDKELPAQQYLDFLNADIIANSSKRGRTSITKRDLKNIEEIRTDLKDLSSGVSDLDEIQVLKEKLDEILEEQYQGKAYTKGKRILVGLRNKVARDLEDSQKGLKEANQAYEAIKGTKRSLGRSLDDSLIETRLRNLYNDRTPLRRIEGFENLEEVAPNDLKFMDKLQDWLARRDFEPTTPGGGGGFGSGAGFANAIRLGTLGKLPTAGKLAAIALMSPKTTGKVIKSGKKAGQLSAQYLPPALANILNQD